MICTLPLSLSPCLTVKCVCSSYWFYPDSHYSFSYHWLSRLLAIRHIIIFLISVHPFISFHSTFLFYLVPRKSIFDTCTYTCSFCKFIASFLERDSIYSSAIYASIIRGIVELAISTRVSLIDHKLDSKNYALSSSTAIVIPFDLSISNYS